MVARLQGDDGGRAGCEQPGRGKSPGLGVRFAFAFVVSLADNLVSRAEQDTAHGRVRARRSEAGGQGDGTPHGGEFRS
jgi:hypothetical protein